MRVYDDRRQAGELLASELEKHRGALVLGIPRGGVTIAGVIADRIDGELDVAIARKIGAPSNPELAMGAVGVDGVPLLDTAIVRALGVSESAVADEVARQTDEAKRRLAVYRGERPAPSIQGRTVIVADDGVATGATIKAVLTEVRRQEPALLIVAVPCGPPPTIVELGQLADEVVCPLQPPGFMSVGQWYRDFTQVTDDEVLELLQRQGEQR